MLLTTAQGQCIRFLIDEVRLFKGRDPTACAASSWTTATR